MRYLLNLPLILTLVCLARAFHLTIASPFGGSDRMLGVLWEIVLETGLAWLLLAVVIGSCGAMGGLRWPDLAGFNGVVAALMIFGVILFVLALPLIRGSLPATVFWLPAILIPQVLFTAGLCWFLAALAVFVRDLGQVIGYVITIGCF